MKWKRKTKWNQDMPWFKAEVKESSSSQANQPDLLVLITAEEKGQVCQDPNRAQVLEVPKSKCGNVFTQLALAMKIVLVELLIQGFHSPSKAALPLFSASCSPGSWLMSCPFVLPVWGASCLAHLYANWVPFYCCLVWLLRMALFLTYMYNPKASFLFGPAAVRQMVLHSCLQVVHLNDALFCWTLTALTLLHCTWVFWITNVPQPCEGKEFAFVSHYCHCYSLLAVAVINARTKNNLGRKVTFHHGERPRQEPKAELEEETTENCCLLLALCQISHTAQNLGMCFPRGAGPCTSTSSQE